MLRAILGILSPDWLSFATPVVAVIAWALRLEGRLNTHVKANEVFQNSIRDIIKTEFEGLDDRLARIETAIIRRAYGELNRPNGPAGPPSDPK